MQTRAVRYGRPAPMITASATKGENLSLFSMYCGEKRTPVDVTPGRQVAGVAGQEPALGIEHLRAGGGVLVVRRHHIGVPHDDLAEPLLIGLPDRNLDPRHRISDRLMMDVVGAVDGMGAERLGLTVE